MDDEDNYFVLMVKLLIIKFTHVKLITRKI